VKWNKGEKADGSDSIAVQVVFPLFFLFMFLIYLALIYTKR